MWYLYLLMAFLFPGVEPDDLIDEPDEPDAPDEPDEPADEPEPDEPADEPDEPDEPAPRVSRAQQAIIKTRERAQQAERELAEARRQLDEARRAPSQQAQPTPDQLLWQQEEETLRNPEATDWQRYAIQANRSARQATATSQDALRRAEDMADKTAFAAVAASKPKLYAAYKDRVEDMLKELRGRGNNAPREKLLAILVGEDMLSGKLKSSDTKAARPGAPTRASARSDVSPSQGGSRLSDSEKRAKRLENVRI